ncbi:MAG TPA: 3-deoxy-7-phosphoheptulonate synthase, partial [Cyanobacteria bacterium UBA8543]|nr:3-deoxy-7-phosphoheptulonate synthase [Cyanobacteria bacterium UBA8543]
MPNRLFNAHIATERVLLTPSDIKSKLPLTDSTRKTVLKFRAEIGNILKGQDDRKFVV